MKFLYTVDPSAPEPIMLISGDIGEGGIEGAQFQAELLTLDNMGKDRIQVYIHSPGGEVAAGMIIYNAILKSRTKVDTYNTGIAASIAAVIFQAGRYRYMADYSILMFHAAYYPGSSKTDPYLDAMKNAIEVMVKRAGLSTQAVYKLLNNGDTFLTAVEAKEARLCDYIELSADQNAKHGNSVVKSSLIQGRAAASNYITGTFKGQANVLNIMTDIQKRHNQKS